MKTRIISLILALATLISCLGLNVFAADEGGAAAASTAVQRTSNTIPVSEFKTAVDESKIVYANDFNDFAITARGNYNVGGDNFVIMNNGGTFSTVVDDDGDTYIKQGAMAQDGTAADGFFQITNSGRNTVNSVSALIANGDWSVNASYIVSFDYAMLVGGRTHRIINEIRTYTAGNSSMALGDVLLCDSGGYLNYSDGGELIQLKSVQFAAGRFYNIVFHHTPKTNSYDVYVDGALILDDIKAFSDANYAYLTDGIFVPGYIRGDSKHNKWGGIDLYGIDNVKMYYSDTNLECAHNNVNGTCEWCGKAISVHSEHEIKDMIAPEDLAAVVGQDNVRYAYDFDGYTITDVGGYTAGGDYGYIYNNSGVIQTVTDEESGNTYIKYGAKADNGTNKDTYFNISNPDRYNWNMVNPLVTGNSPIVNAPYVVSLDYVRLGAEVKHYIIKQILSYTGPESSGAGRFITLGDILCVDSEGYLCYNNGNGGAETIVKLTDVKFETGRFYNIAFHHTPAKNTYDVYVDGKLVVDDAVALNASDIEKTGGEFGKFVPSLVRTEMDTKNYSGADIFGFDNVKFYNSAVNLECAHSYTDSNVCDWCGAEAQLEYCTTCKGEILSEGSAVVSKSVSLGETITVNVYLKLMQRLLENEDATVVLECNGEKTEYAISEAVAESDGLYKFSIDLTAVQMTEVVKVSVTGEKSETFLTSVEDYALQLITEGKKQDAIALAKAMLNYGAAAQIYFAARNNSPTLDDKLANAGLSDEDKTVSDITVDDLVDYEFWSDGATAEVNFIGVSFIFEAKTSMKLYFNASADAVVNVDGVECEKLSQNGAYYVTLVIDTPADASVEFAVEITDGDTVLETSISAYTAIHAGLSNAQTGESFEALLKAYTDYCERAIVYAG